MRHAQENPSLEDVGPSSSSIPRPLVTAIDVIAKKDASHSKARRRVACT